MYALFLHSLCLTICYNHRTDRCCCQDEMKRLPKLKIKSAALCNGVIVDDRYMKQQESSGFTKSYLYSIQAQVYSFCWLVVQNEIVIDEFLKSTELELQSLYIDDTQAVDLGQYAAYCLKAIWAWIWKITSRVNPSKTVNIGSEAYNIIFLIQNWVSLPNARLLCTIIWWSSWSHSQSASNSYRHESICTMCFLMY